MDRHVYIQEAVEPILANRWLNWTLGLRKHLDAGDLDTFAGEVSEILQAVFASCWHMFLENKSVAFQMFMKGKYSQIVFKNFNKLMIVQTKLHWFLLQLLCQNPSEVIGNHFSGNGVITPLWGQISFSMGHLSCQCVGCYIFVSEGASFIFWVLVQQ